MITVIKDWQVVTIFENNQPIGRVIYATVVDDSTFRFTPGDYLCTSQITEVNIATRFIKTASGSIYQPLGEGKKSSIEFADFELLRSGFSPQEINTLNSLTPESVH